jgi:hypothetical protein
MKPMVAVLLPLSLLACGEETVPQDDPGDPKELEYMGAEFDEIDDELLGVRVSIRRTDLSEDVVAYGECVVAGHALKKDLGFARHLRTKTQVKGGVISANAVYTLSKTLPKGLVTIDAAEKVANCRELGIPTE